MNFCFFKIRVEKVIKIILLIVLLAIGYWTSASGEYIKVVDGDSLEIGSRRIRLLEIDAPEFKQYCFDRAGQKYQCGKESLYYLKKMLKEASFKVTCRTQKKDRYQRELAECFANGKNINLEMIRSGWAVTYRTENQEYFDAEKEAKKLKKGIWQGKFMRPEYFRRLQRRENR